MKSMIVFLCTVAICTAYPAVPYRNRAELSKTPATIVQQDYINAGTGYNFAYQTSDGATREETAEIKNAGQKDESIVVQGSYSYIGEDGVTYTISYIADENGYRPTGQHIPAL